MNVAYTGTTTLIEWGDSEWDRYGDSDDYAPLQALSISSLTGLVSIIDSDGAEVLVAPEEIDSLIDALKEAKNHVKG